MERTFSAAKTGKKRVLTASEISTMGKNISRQGKMRKYFFTGEFLTCEGYEGKKRGS
ncbi:MAG: hypothetical protein LBQ44_08645 [Treponema sp.]|nr:hypothetical protein [Treponema sp.]